MEGYFELHEVDSKVEIIRGLLIKGTLIADLAVDYLALFGYMTLFTVLSIWRFKKYLN